MVINDHDLIHPYHGHSLQVYEHCVKRRADPGGSVQSWSTIKINWQRNVRDYCFSEDY